MNAWRLFCAVELPSDVRARLEEHVRELRAAVPDVAASWTRIENIHLTLKFFGNVDVNRVADISAAASRATEQFSAFEIEIGGTGVFPKPSRAQVLWVGVKDSSGQLLALQTQMENEFASLGFEKEDRAFKPHLTIARLRRLDGKLAEKHLQRDFKPHEIEVREVILFRTELSSKGSKYTALSKHALTTNLHE